MELGLIQTDAEKVLAYIEERVKDYALDKYKGDADAAKKDRAELNKADKRMQEMSKELSDQWNAPLQPTIDLLKRGRTLIKEASAAVDSLVKAKEAEEDEKKRNQITEYWNTRNFDLVPLERIFDPRWLNKGASLTKEVYPAIDAKINEIYESIKTIEDVGGEDVDVMKSEYFKTLDLGAAVRRGNELKADRERIEREKATRAQREQTAQLNEQNRELIKEEAETKKAEPVRSVAAAALGITPSDPGLEIVTYVMEFTGTRNAMFQLREYMTKNGITYKKIEAAV
jgi:exonuclease VII small subunit